MPTKKFEKGHKHGGAPKGNSNAAKGARWRNAIKAALAADPEALHRCAMALINAAELGDIQAIKELGDRLDGKPKQAVEQELTVTHQGGVDIPPRSESYEEWLERRNRELGAAAGPSDARH